MTLANAVFFSLPRVFRACPTLANTVFSTLPGVRNENRPSIRFFRLTRSCSHCYKHFRAATSFPAALHFPPRRQRHFQRRSTFHRAANVISSGAPLFTAPPTSFPAALHFSPRRQHHFQRCSSFHCAANVISSGAPLSTTPPTSFPAALHFPPRRQRHFQRHSLFTAPPTSFPAVLRFLPRRQRHFQRRSALHRTTTILHNSAPPKKATGKPVAILNNEHAQNCYFFRISIAFGVREF